jgi:hypothetical protein
LVSLPWFALGLAAILAATENGTHPIQQTGILEAVIPAPLQPLLLENAQVKFLVTVNEEGKIVDHLAIAATHHELLARADQALLQATFAPATDQGKPVQSSAEVTVFFFDPEQRAVRSGLISQPHGLTATEGAMRRIYEVSKARFAYRRAVAAELDHPVEAKETKVMVLTDAAGVPAAGGCVVDFYIDPQGEVRMPRVVSSDNETVALSALLTLQHTRYSPVTRNGVPAYVKVRQPISYAAAEVAPAAAK